MKNPSLERPQQILFATLVGVSLLVTLASAVSTRRPPQADPPAAPPTAPAVASPTTTIPPSPTVPAPAWPPPTATPITDLKTLAQQSDGIVDVKSTGTNGAQHSILVYIQVQEWFKKPAQASTDRGVVWILDPFAGEFTRPRISWIGDGEEAILFLYVQGPNPWNDGSLAYELTGAPEGDPAIYQIRDGRIIDAGLPQYQGWTVTDFAAAIRAVLPRPELGFAPVRPR